MIGRFLTDLPDADLRRGCLALRRCARFVNESTSRTNVGSGLTACRLTHRSIDRKIKRAVLPNAWAQHLCHNFLSRSRSTPRGEDVECFGLGAHFRSLRSAEAQLLCRVRMEKREHEASAPSSAPKKARSDEDAAHAQAIAAAKPAAPAAAGAPPSGKEEKHEKEEPSPFASFKIASHVSHPSIDRCLRPLRDLRTMHCVEASVLRDVL